MKNYNRNGKNPSWKGDSVGYGALHNWVRRHKSKPEYCEECNKNKPHDLANISGEYKRDINDFKWLCRKCHMEMDGRLKKLGKNSPNREIENDFYKCAICNKLKKADCFHYDKTNKGNVHSYCKNCRKIKRRENYLKSKIVKEKKNDRC